MFTDRLPWESRRPASGLVEEHLYDVTLEGSEDVTVLHRLLEENAAARDTLEELQEKLGGGVGC